MIYHLYIALCAQHPESPVSFCHHICDPLYSLYSPPYPFLLVTFYDFVLFVPLLLSVLRPTYERKHMVLVLSCLIFLSMIPSGSTHVVANGNISSLSMYFLIIYESIHCEKLCRQWWSCLLCLFFLTPVLPC